MAINVPGRDTITRQLTKAQLKRRSVILSVARNLVATRGYAGVTMRELARKSGVAYKTLYDVYGSKDDLLCSAVKDRLCRIFKAINSEVTGSGFDRLIQIIERSSRATLDAPGLARALEPILATDPGKFSIWQIYSEVHRPALEEIRRKGDLVTWADIDFITHELMIDNGSVRLAWANGVISDAELIPMQKYVVCTDLAPLVTGATKRKVLSLHRELYDVLKSKFDTEPVGRPE